MQIFLNLVLHALLIGSMFAFIASAVLLVFKTDNSLERAIRAGAVFSGAMVVLGARAAGLSFGDFIVESMSATTLKGNVAAVAGAVVPSSLGVGLSMHLLRAFKRNETIAIRILGFVGTLAAMQFAEIYAAAVDTRGLDLGKVAIPNISFVVGIILYIVLKFDPQSKRFRPPSAWSQLLRGSPPLGGSVRLRSTGDEIGGARKTGFEDSKEI